MKKTLQILFALSLIVSNIKAQVYNGDFESLNSIGGVSNWGNVYLLSAWIDSSGVLVQDSIEYDGPFYAPTNDAHSGSQALELRNAFNYTTGIGMAGMVTNDTDSVYTAWGCVEMVPLQVLPNELNFWCKYTSANNDTGMAYVVIVDDMGNIMAQEIVQITETFGNYVNYAVPIPYTYSAIPMMYMLSFSTCQFNSLPNLGSRLVVDDVELTTTTGLNVLKIKPNDVLLYPNPARDFININSTLKSNSTFMMYNSVGSIVDEGELQIGETQIATNDLNNGIYTIHIINDGEVITRKCLVNR